MVTRTGSVVGGGSLEDRIEVVCMGTRRKVETAKVVTDVGNPGQIFYRSRSD